MENPNLRMAMGIKPDQKGVRIRRIDPTAPESKVLKSSDVIHSFDGLILPMMEQVIEWFCFGFFIHYAQHIAYICLGVLCLATKN